MAAAERRNNVSHGREPVELDRTQSQPRRGGTTRRWICAAPDGASAESKFKTTGSRPWLKLYRRSAATKRGNYRVECGDERSGVRLAFGASPVRGGTTRRWICAS